MAEFAYNPVQEIAAGGNVLLNTVIPCKRGYVVHREQSGVSTLRGIVNNPTNCFARYRVSFNANIAIPTGGTVESISMAIAIDGEPIPTSSAIVSPAAVGDYWNVQCSATIDVIKGCCDSIAVENTSAQAINVQNANLIIDRTA